MKILKAQKVFDFEQPDWSKDPIMFIAHQILEQELEIIKLASPCFPNLDKNNQMGRSGMTLEQIVRCAIYKQNKELTYRELSIHTYDSKMGIVFMKILDGQGFSHQTLQEHISAITPEVLEKINIKIGKIAIELKLDDGKKMRTDSTAIPAHIHHPTNCSLLWDCIRVGTRILKKTKAIFSEIDVRFWQKSAKKLNFQIVNTRGQEKRIPLFKKLLRIQEKYIAQIETTITYLKQISVEDAKIEKERQQLILELESLLPKMRTVYGAAYRKEILGEKVAIKDKLFSIFEDHTDCIVKGQRLPTFGHKVNLTSGKSNIIFDVIIERGNPNDTEYYSKTLCNLKNNYNLIPRDFSTDGGYASIKNLDFAKEHGVKNIVFGKTKGKLQNITSSKKMQTILKKWRSGIEAIISNLKRAYDSALCKWKGYEKFKSHTLWSVITYNLMMIASLLLDK